MPDITIAINPDVTTEEFIDVLRRSELDLRRPVADAQRIETMLRNADIIAAARDKRGVLVGIARALSDFAFCTYLSDLAVDKAVQRQGVGRQLVATIHQAAPSTTLILLSAPLAVDYYPRLGMQLHPSCWTLPPLSTPTCLFREN